MTAGDRDAGVGPAPPETVALWVKLVASMCSYVDKARGRGEPVERVIIDLKQEMRAAGVVDRYQRPDERPLAESVIRWCIERYYGSPPRGD